MSLHRANLDGYLATPTIAQQYVKAFLYGRSRTTIFDVGACEGEDSIRYARLFPKGQVYAFEPLPENLELARANFPKYSAHNVALQPFALSDKPGEATFHVSSAPPDYTPFGADWNHGNKSSSLLPPASDLPMHGFVSFASEITVRCERLDDFCTEHGIKHIDFMHMDVQGAESLVLAGAQRMLPNIFAIWLEVASVELYRGQKLRGDIEETLRAHHFELLVHQAAGASEANQFYLNRRTFRGKVMLAILRMRRFLKSLRHGRTGHAPSDTLQDGADVRTGENRS